METPADFSLTVVKLVAAELYFLVGMTAAREMFGKSYFSLGVAEKGIVDQEVMKNTFGNLAAITPELIAAHTPGPTPAQGPIAQTPTQKTAGFQVPLEEKAPK